MKCWKLEQISVRKSAIGIHFYMPSEKQYNNWNQAFRWYSQKQSNRTRRFLTNRHKSRNLRKSWMQNILEKNVFFPLKAGCSAFCRFLWKSVFPKKCFRKPWFPKAWNWPLTC